MHKTAEAELLVCSKLLLFYGKDKQKKGREKANIAHEVLSSGLLCGNGGGCSFLLHVRFCRVQKIGEEGRGKELRQKNSNRKEQRSICGYFFLP